MTKKVIVTIIKFVTFVLLWALLLSLILAFCGEPAFINNNEALQMLYIETVTFILVILCTFLYVFAIERKKVIVPLSRKPLKDSVIGLIIGCVWIGFPMLLFYVFGLMKFGNINATPLLPIYILALFLNTCMQEYLVRGYLFSLVNDKFNKIVAVIATTILFTVFHAGAFEAGIIPVLNVLTMSLLASTLQIYTGGLLAPILMHFTWNFIGGFITNAISIGAYPNIINVHLSGSKILSGGDVGIEGSIITLLINIILIFSLLYGKRKTGKSITTE